MSEKSYVTLAQVLCVVCCEPYDSGELLIDRRLLPTFERKTTVGWGKLCPKCQKYKDDGFVAMVEVKNPDVGQPTIKPADAERTGRYAHLKSEAYCRVFVQMELPPNGVVMCSGDVLDYLESLVQKETEQ